MYLCMVLGDLNLFIFVNTRAIFRFILSVIYLWYWRWWCNSLIITRHTYICRHLIDSANTDVIKVCYLCKLVRNQGQTRLRIEWYYVDAECRIVWVLIISKSIFIVHVKSSLRYFNWNKNKNFTMVSDRCT